MTIKICLKPDPKLKENHGIGRVLHAQHRYLPQFGFEFVESDADLYIGHTQQFDMPRIDALLCHGLYWTGDEGSGEYTAYANAANFEIVQAARRARVVVVPSEWVAMPFKRDMRINPIVIGHGIDVDQWSIGKPQGYALWNKNRDTDVCNPIAAHELAKRGVRVMTTYAAKGAQRPKTLEIIGIQESDAMKEIIGGADVYLSTTKETFGIGTLEAMACGVPVLGWNTGGTAEIVTNGIDGVLVKPGDYDALYAGYKAIMADRAGMGNAARITASRYDWLSAMKQYAELFTQLYEAIHTEPRGVSVVITNHNYARYVGDAIHSVITQTRTPNEIIVVDDGSTDDSLKIINKALPPVSSFRVFVDGPAVEVKVITQSNQGVAAARTTGIAHSTQPYITLLDADDVLMPTFVETLHDALLKDRALGIAYTGILGFSDTGGEWETSFPPEFTWNQQAQNTTPPSNCIPSACMFRREMWLRAGPHKQEYAPGEDAEFWTRGLATGFTAQRVTADRLFHYRLHQGSATHEKKYKPIDDRLPWLRDHRFPLAVPLDKTVPAIRSYSDPVISIVISVRDGHAAHLADAIDSVLGQTVREWELIVVDQTFADNSTQIDPLVIRRYPFANWTICDYRGVAAARNAGLAEAKAPLVVFLDPEDELMPDALYRMAAAFVEHEGGRYIYGDTHQVKRRVETRAHFSPWPALVTDEKRSAKIAALIPREWLLDVGGYTDAAAQDDNDLYVRLARKGYCGHHIDRVSLVQRVHLNGNVKLAATSWLLESEANMSSCCGGNGEAILAARRMLENMPQEINTYSGDPVGGLVRMQYTGSNVGDYTYNGRAGRTYRGGANEIGRFAWVHPDDVEVMERTSKWVRAPEKPPVVQAENKPTPKPEPQIVATPAIAPEPLLEAVATLEPEAMIKTGNLVDDAIANGYKEVAGEMKPHTPKRKRAR